MKKFTSIIQAILLTILINICSYGFLVNAYARVNYEKINIILLGSPGAGKSTQAEYLSEHYHIPIVSTGNILRAEVKLKTRLGLQVKQIMEKGGLVPADIIIALIKKRIQQDDCKDGFLLDGAPRTIEEAKKINDAGIYINYVIDIYVPSEEAAMRVSGRRIHQASGRVYHIKYNPPKIAGIDDVTGEPLVQRTDDQESIVRKRLQTYHEKTEILGKFYQDLATKQTIKKLRYIKIDGVGSVENIKNLIFSKINNKA